SRRSPLRPVFAPLRLGEHRLMSELSIHGANVLYLASYLVRDILALRVLTVVAGGEMSYVTTEPTSASVWTREATEVRRLGARQARPTLRKASRGSSWRSDGHRRRSGEEAQKTAEKQQMRTFGTDVPACRYTSEFHASRASHWG